MRIHSAFLIVGAASILFAACGNRNDLEDVSQIVGPYEAEGVIAATGSSLVRRGTHVLLMNGRERFFLESKTLDLNDFAGMTAKVEGEMGPNTHPSFLPVMQVTAVTPLEEATSPELQRYTVTPLGLTLEAPRTWKNALQNGRMTFSIEGEDGPFIAIQHGEAGYMPEEGIPVRIDGKNGVRVIDEETGVHSVYIKVTPDEILVLTFGPKGEESMQQRDAFYTLLQSIIFDEREEQSSSEKQKLTGSLQPCGGPAAVLCPEGEYCHVQEIDTGIGVCVTLE